MYVIFIVLDLLLKPVSAILYALKLSCTFFTINSVQPVLQ